MKSKVNLNLVREINSSVILCLLKDRAPLSKYDISRITGLSAPAVANIVTVLLEAGFVRESGMGESFGGRPPLLLELNSAGGFVAGVDIGNDNIASVVANIKGEIVAANETPTDLSSGELKVFAKILSNISECIRMSGCDRSLILGMGVGVSGDIDPENGVIRYASRLGWRDVPIRAMLAESFQMPVFVEENVRLLSVAEKYCGAGRGHDDIVCLRVGDDIGAGIILDGSLFQGSDGKAGAVIGSMDICGRPLSSLISSKAILARISELSGHEGHVPESVKEAAEMAANGDAACRQAFDETGRNLASAINNIFTCLDPEILILGGGIPMAGDTLLKPVRSRLVELTGDPGAGDKVVRAQLGGEAFSLGAATLVLHKVFQTLRDFMKQG